MVDKVRVDTDQRLEADDVDRFGNFAEDAHQDMRHLMGDYVLGEATVGLTVPVGASPSILRPPDISFINLIVTVEMKDAVTGKARIYDAQGKMIPSEEGDVPNSRTVDLAAVAGVPGDYWIFVRRVQTAAKNESRIFINPITRQEYSKATYTENLDDYELDYEAKVGAIPTTARVDAGWVAVAVATIGGGTITALVATTMGSTFYPDALKTMNDWTPFLDLKLADGAVARSSMELKGRLTDILKMCVQSICEMRGGGRQGTSVLGIRYETLGHFNTDGGVTYVPQAVADAKKINEITTHLRIEEHTGDLDYPFNAIEYTPDDFLAAAPVVPAIAKTGIYNPFGFCADALAGTTGYPNKVEKGFVYHEYDTPGSIGVEKWLAFAISGMRWTTGYASTTYNPYDVGNPDLSHTWILTGATSYIGSIPILLPHRCRVRGSKLSYKVTVNGSGSVAITASLVKTTMNVGAGTRTWNGGITNGSVLKAGVTNWEECADVGLVESAVRNNDQENDVWLMTVIVTNGAVGDTVYIGDAFVQISILEASGAYYSDT